MRLIKLALLSLFVFFSIITAFSLFIPAHIRISKAINMEGNRDRILLLVSDTAQWRQWHPAFQQQSVSATLKSNNLAMKQLLKTDTLILTELIQKGKRPVINGWQLYHYTSTDSLTLQWYMDFHLKWYPWQKFSSLFYEGTYGKMMEKGLSNIKKEVEQ
jgi:hypothetical protein